MYSLHKSPSSLTSVHGAPRVRAPCENFLSGRRLAASRRCSASERRAIVFAGPTAAREKGWRLWLRLVPLRSVRPSSPPHRRRLFASISAWAIVTDLGNVAIVHSPVAEHADQGDLNSATRTQRAFTEAFELGDELFATPFNALDGGGANVGRGQRFTRVPRADLRGRGEWFKHVPSRVTGPNAAGCFECHEQPFEDGAGTAAQNVHRDPFRTGPSASSSSATRRTSSRRAPSSGWPRR